MSIKLVDTTDTRSLLEQLAIDDWWERKQRWAEMARRARDAVEALEREEYTEIVERMDLSRQDVEEMCRALEEGIRHAERINSRTIKHLRSLAPRRIWSGK
jgi:hypothetical protein